MHAPAACSGSRRSSPKRPANATSHLAAATSRGTTLQQFVCPVCSFASCRSNSHQRLALLAAMGGSNQSRQQVNNGTSLQVNSDRRNNNHHSVPDQHHYPNHSNYRGLHHKHAVAASLNDSSYSRSSGRMNDSDSVHQLDELQKLRCSEPTLLARNCADDRTAGSNGSLRAGDTGVRKGRRLREAQAMLENFSASSSAKDNHGKAGKLFQHRLLGKNNNTIERREVRVLKCKATIDKRPTFLDENSTSVFKYRTPHFRATATLEIPALDEGEQVQIGWIQMCTEMTFMNSYGSEGVTSWEFPEIMSGKWKMVSDADGKLYPWYGSRHEVHLVKGPHEPHTTTVYMNDNFFPQVTWHIPNKHYDKIPRLTHIYRKQKFFTFLACTYNFGKDYEILKTVSWGMKLNISVNPQNQLGHRSKLEPPYEQEMPQVLDKNVVRLESYALNPPNANSCQVLVWRPHNGTPSMVVPPRQTTVDMANYMTNVKGPKLAHIL